LEAIQLLLHPVLLALGCLKVSVQLERLSARLSLLNFSLGQQFKSFSDEELGLGPESARASAQIDFSSFGPLRVVDSI